MDDIEERPDGLTYKKGISSPFTGVAVQYYKDGKKEMEVTYVEGMAHGQSIRWSPKGKKEAVIEFEKGEIIGSKELDQEDSP